MNRSSKKKRIENKLKLILKDPSKNAEIENSHENERSDKHGDVSRQHVHVEWQRIRHSLTIGCEAGSDLSWNTIDDFRFHLNRHRTYYTLNKIKWLVFSSKAVQKCRIFAHQSYSHRRIQFPDWSPIGRDRYEYFCQFACASTWTCLRAYLRTGLWKRSKIKVQLSKIKLQTPRTTGWPWFRRFCAAYRSLILRQRPQRWPHRCRRGWTHGLWCKD